VQARGRALKSFYKGRLQAEKFEHGAAALERGDVWTGRFVLVDAAGDTRMCDQSLSPVWAKHGRILGYAFIWRDATEVAQLERQLRHAQKLEILGTLAGGIAHDFRNILGPIILHAELCLERVGKDHPLTPSLQEILEAVRRARALGEQLLSLGRGVESDRPVRFRLGTLVRQCVKLMRPGLPPGIAIRLQGNAEHDEMRADPAQVHQVVMNLYANAIEAMKDQEGGLMTLRIEEVPVDETGATRDPPLPPGAYLRLTVSDTGRGMTSDVASRIFEPFFTTKRAGQGTGLGLTVARHIVSRMRGAMDVESCPGLGASFHVLFPKAPPGVGTAARQPAPPPVRATRETVRILFVDQDPVMSRCATLALTRLGHAVTAHSRPGEALAALAAAPEGFDLAMIDPALPRHGGFELIRELTRLRPGLPVVLLSGHGEAISCEMQRACGARLVLAKPFCFDELDKVIREVMAATD
jgi:signal transduction histidine kinase/ActR/RegA family two-component response regulator